MPHLLQLDRFFLEVLTVIIFMTQQKHTSNSKPRRQSKQQPQIRTQRSCSQEMRKLSPLRSWLNSFWTMRSFAGWIRNSTFLIHKRCAYLILSSSFSWMEVTQLLRVGLGLAVGLNPQYSYLVCTTAKLKHSCSNQQFLGIHRSSRTGISQTQKNIVWEISQWEWARYRCFE